MNRRNRWKWLVTAASFSVGVALVAAACGGGGGNKTTTTSGSTSTSSSAAGKSFALFRIATDTGTDYLDPGLSYTVEGWGVMWNVYLPLLGYKHVNGPDGATIVPYLAQSLPTVSSDGKTYTLTLRKGVKYSDGTAVKASDFKATIERDYKVDSPGVGFFGNIVGANEYSKTKTGSISGITANDSTGVITIKLTQPQGDFMNILATEFAAPLPASTPAKDQSTTPAPSTGPYMIQSYAPNKQIVEVRNPSFDASLYGGNVPAGNPDKVVWDVIGDDNVALQRVISGQDDWLGYHPIPPDRLSSVQAKYPNQIKLFTPANTYYFFMNTRVAPFNNLKVRQAVNYAIDRQALVRVYGGLAQPTEQVLPPTYPQYKKIDPYPYNLAKAKQLIAQAGVKGMAVTVWNHDRGLDPRATAYLTDVLNSIGLKATQKIVAAAVYWTTIGNQATKAQIGFADWFQDYPHPLDWFDVLLNGERITQTHNNNYANFDDASVNSQIDALKKEPTLTNAVNARWASVDKEVMAQAPWAPFLNRQFTDFFHSNVDLSCYVNHVLYEFDYSTICMK
ncbi:MAG TPA: ABC transporter substrate-binding protein [Gaiellaceae bacterium]|nr:ABC transporter substrate-binding protein [Gaiellaceae bacterium]